MSSYRIFNEDAFVKLKELDTRSVDLILTDPPYNLSNYSTGNMKFSWRKEINNDLALRQSEKDKVVAIIADKNLNYSMVAELLLVLQDQDFLNVIFMSQPRKERKI